jgi:hypothetical protein
MYGYSSKLEEKLFYNQGFFGASFLYQTYFTIGMASDAWTKGTYTLENTQTILQTSVNFLDLSVKTLKELTLFSITSDDRNTLLQMIDIASDLKNQGSFMIQYMSSKNKQDLDNYELNRKQAWEKISNLMDIK